MILVQLGVNPITQVLAGLPLAVFQDARVEITQAKAIRLGPENETCENWVLLLPEPLPSWARAEGDLKAVSLPGARSEGR